MKVFITGATGFIGTHLVERLAGTQHELRCLVRKSSNVKRIEDCGAALILGDLTDEDALREGMTGCDWVVNLANIYSLWEPDNRIYGEVNIEGTRNVMKCALETGVSKVVHLSTVLVYGRPAECPFTELSPVGPVRFSEYARTKYEGDLIAWDLFENKGLPVVMIYPGMVVGPGNPKFGGQLVRNIVDRRMPIRAFDSRITSMVHVDDVVEAIVRALDKENNIGEKYLLSQQLSYAELYRMVSDISGVPMPKVCVPDRLAMISGTLLTLVADLIGKPPLWGLSGDAMRTGGNDLMPDGSKSERELGITYTPIRVALEQEIASYHA
jgi:dihydroflavonol-4-reductase